MKRLVRKTSKPFALVATILLIAAIGTGSTLAWLMDSSERVNSFVVPEVTPTIVETFEDGDSVKSNVYVKNTVATGETGIDVYIRVALVPTWETADGHVAPISADLDVDLNVVLNLDLIDGWVLYDGYYYHKDTVAPQQATSILIQSATVKTESAGATAGYKMNLQVLAEAIQATKPAVKEAWSADVWDSVLNHV